MKAIATTLAWLALLACAPAAARSGTTPDYSDLWWNSGESGWGAHVTLQDDVVFMVLYVYDDARNPRFFVAPDMARAAGSTSIHEGPLYRTTGPAFAGAFDPARVTSQAVGSARLAFTTPTEATLEYTVGNARVRKVLARQSWRPPSLAGNYKGGLFATATASTCPLGLPTLAYPGSLGVKQEGDAVTIDMAFAPGFSESGTCRMTGRLVAQGSLASLVDGTYDCRFSNSNTVSGTFELTAIESGETGFGGRYSGVEGAACRHSGYLGGMRRGYANLPEPPPPPPPPPDPRDD